MTKVVFLVEEPSMKVLLQSMLPKLLPQLRFECIAHDGKQQLEKSIPRKLRAWKEPGVAFVVVRDKDAADCRAVKSKLAKVCTDAGRPDTLVRIVCHELESWYLGDLQAVAEAYGKPKLPELSAKAKFRDPDRIQRPSVELARLVPEFSKTSGPRMIGERLVEGRNHSQSFRVFLGGIRRLAGLATGGR